MSTDQPTNAAIVAANLIALQHRLRRALRVTTEAVRANNDGQRNLVTGTLLDLASLLPECDALYRTIMLVQRSGFECDSDEVRS